MSFKVVHILETDDIEPCPYLWEENGVLYWPPSQHLARKYQSVATSKPDRKTWKKYRCEVKEKDILIFMYASQSCEQYMSATEKESTTSASENEEFQTAPAVIKRSIPAKKNAKNAASEQKKYTFTDKQKATSSVVKKYDVKPATKSNEPQINKKTTSDQIKVKQQENRQDVIQDINKLFDFVKEWKDDLNKQFRDCFIRLDKIEELIQKKVYETPESSGDEIDMFPLNLSVDLIKFDKDLNNFDFKKKVLSHLNKLIGSGPMTAKAACYKICNSMFSKELLTQFSWTGMSRTHSKHSFQKLKNVLEIFFKLVYKSDQTFSYAQRDAFFRDGILKHSHTRLSQPWKLKKKKTEQKELEQEEFVLENKEEDEEENQQNVAYNEYEEEFEEENDSYAGSYTEGEEQNSNDVTLIHTLENGEAGY